MFESWSLRTHCVRKVPMPTAGLMIESASAGPPALMAGENDGVEVERLPDEADAAAHHHGGGRAEDGGLRNAQDAVLHRARNVGGVECEALAKHVPEVEREPAQKVLHRQQAQQAACAGLDLQEFAALHLT